MSLKKEGYKERLIDDKLKTYLSVFGAVNIEGPKWCGKTWTALNYSNSVIFLDDEETYNRAKFSLDLIMDLDRPQLIVEWNLIPKVWDKVRRKCDETKGKGKFILTCSTKLLDDEFEKEIFHSGAGRIGTIKMNTMSLYESGNSTGLVSLKDIVDGKFKSGVNEKISIEKLAYYIVRGGWPENIDAKKGVNDIIPKNYVKSILEREINISKKRDKPKMEMLLKSLARNTCSTVSNNSILKDIEESNDEKSLIKSKNTLSDYLNVLLKLHIIDYQNPYSSNYRFPQRVGKTSKRHFIDPSLTCAILNMNEEKLISDLNTFGFVFESLVYRDLKVYMDYLGGEVFHFRDNVSGLEVDSILEFSDGEYAAVEVKLGTNQIDDAKSNLLKFKDNMTKEPKFMCIIVGNIDYFVQDEETGIYIVPLTALKP